jgi:hypothetical protein
MTNLIDNFIEQNKTIENFLDEVGRDYENSDKKLASFRDFLIQTKYNVAVGTDLANFLQCLNKEENFSDFHLSDISRLFDSLLKIEKFNIDTYLEAGHFEWAVMDNKEKAIEIIKKVLAKHRKRQKNLKDCLTQ